MNFYKNWNKIFKKMKLRSLWYTHFVLPILFVLTLASDKGVLYENVVFSILVISTKKRYSNFFKKVSAFQKICFRVKVLKTFKISGLSHKTCLSLKGRAISKIAGGISLQELMPFLLALKWNLFEKTNSNFTVKLAEKSTRSFSIYLMNPLFQISAFFNMRK